MSGMRRSNGQLSDRIVVLDDGHRVGVSVGGRGVPLVLQHGVAMRRQTYAELSERLLDMGFRVIAIDAPGHGETAPLPPEDRSFAGMTALTVRTLDALGIQRAVFLGHSMGGRMTVELAARYPRRVLAAILVDAAAGAAMDAKAQRAHEAPGTIVWGLVAAFCDATLEHVTLRGKRHLRYARLIAWSALETLRRPGEPLWALRAIAASSDSAEHLRTMAAHRVPTMVVHARHDMVVPWDSAVDMARVAQGVLYEVPGAHHGWIIADPDRGAAMIAQLLEGQLGAALRSAYHSEGHQGAEEWTAWTDALAPAAGAPRQRAT